MSTTQEPDFAGRARAMAEAHFCQAAFEADPSIEQTYGWDQMLIGLESERIEAYASCMEAKLRSDWETIRLLRDARSFVRRDGENDRGLSHRIDAHLSTLEAQFQ